ncbi:MAG: dihydropteroate synthase [Chitinophagales bacterium]|nr:dihydropteroate synthase [Chitinophagales bacterium]
MQNQDLCYKEFSINCKGNLISLRTPMVMGVVNLTQDSFFDGGQYFDFEKALLQVEKDVHDGAAIIDLGATTTRSGTPVSHPDDEIKKLIPVIEAIKKSFPQTLISIDTYHSQVTEACLEKGADIINDISGGTIDEKIFEVTARYRAPYILMHIQGTPETMQIQPHYNNLMQEVIQQLKRQCDKAISYGIKDIIIDPGIGFGKTTEQNFELLQNLEVLSVLSHPILIGVSRKSLIWKTLQSSPQEALTGTIALNMHALSKGANILRVHDVKEAKETIEMYLALEKNR